jgi:BirA family biotin operon repressor/biotin-[acetyl-CoA-carboxylase] ligase
MAQYPTGKKKIFYPKGKKNSPRKKLDPNLFVLSSLLQASPHYVSGNYLADRLKMSRVGVWSRVDKLRKAGLSIEASQNRGYRLAGEPDVLVRPLLEAWLRECKIDLPVHLLELSDSTNSEAERLLAMGHEAPFAVLSQKQTKGRGRMGKTWHSPKVGNLYLSIALRPNVELLKFRNFTLWQGISIGKFLRNHTGIENLLVKWPNDLIANNKKLGGMLTEASIDCDQVRSIVFGIGLNINSSPSDFPEEIKERSTSLKEISQLSWRMHEIAAKIIKVSLKASQECILGTADPLLMNEWQSMDFLSGRRVKIKNGKASYSGKADGIDPSGGLLIKLRNGRHKIAHAGEVSLIP